MEVFYKKRKDLFKRQTSTLSTRTDADEDLSNDCEIYTRSVRPSNPATICGATEDTFTVDDALEAVGFGKYQWKISLYAGLSWIADAMEMMILSILGPQLRCEWALLSYEVAFITSVVFIGMGVSSPLWGNLSDKHGRRTGLIAMMVWTLFYGLLSSFAPRYGWMITLRALVGFGVGGAPQSVTLYSEFLPVKARGKSVMLIGAFWALGAMCEVALALLVMPTLGWRWLLGLSVLPMAIFVLFCHWLPESPHFDILRGRRDKALKTLKQMAKDNKKSLPKGRLICRNVQINRGGIKDLFIPQYLRTTLLLWFIWFVNAFCYYGIVLLTTEMFQHGGACGTTQVNKSEHTCRLGCKDLTTKDYVDLLWTTLAEFPGVLLILLGIDQIGRKNSMALGFILFTLCMLPMYGCVGRVSLTILIFAARALISGGYQAVFVYTPEVYPTEVRALAMGICSSFAKLGALLTPFVAQVLLRSSVSLTLSVYWLCSLLAGIATLFLPIETVGRSMQERGAEEEAGIGSTPSTEQVASAHTLT